MLTNDMFFIIFVLSLGCFVKGKHLPIYHNALKTRKSVRGVLTKMFYNEESYTIVMR